MSLSGFHSGASSTYTVSRLNREIRSILEQGFASIRLSGEISNFVAPASGHWYFSLKDDKAQIKAAMWRGNNRYCQYKPTNGAQVEVQARVSVYEPRGDYQLIVEKMEAAGEGLLKQQFDELKMRLAAEGLFSSVHKKPMPSQINKVGVITSATGAAIKDILTVLKRRAPQLEVIIYPAQVQGKEAHLQLIEKLTIANQRAEVDVLIIGRGGGSLEDMWCFNEEPLARAIFASQLPVISAVGHEIDTTISDYVADLRAATPSAAAELVSPDQMALQQQLMQYKRALHIQVQQAIKHTRHYCATLEQRLKLQHPENQLLQQQQRVDELSSRLSRAFLQMQSQRSSHLGLVKQRLSHQHPTRRLQDSTQQLQQLKNALIQAMQKQQQLRQNQLALYAARLDSVSPLNVLARGYSITSQQQSVIKSVAQVNTQQPLVTRLHDGEVHSHIVNIKPY
ncbi:MULTISPECIES: exodeoxyribonuclease VII large subunit [Pseudoalteromonas]|uniref:Exodeoxyribonuclease 7 large subunit n=1 Tax=Pseudoalteromonas amylolytica TaxID=1859457 RepID=A0A1S1MUK0_9GAMM|nr:MULTISPECIES: exodeoxyribonuclease VII large subunit [Pseudoalteromonas]OHU88526.1 exodeoxyribonuclease VII large subunit [Pseudoalteromonas sp. JW3]OHU90369.1 exodeoxyribonuclease VII large subunit [Pseudoalteromonas amylolytica]